MKSTLLTALCCLSAMVLVGSAITQADADAPMEPAVAEQVPTPARPVAVDATRDSYLWTYSNGGVISEPFLHYTARTGKGSPATASTCSTGYCGTFASSPTLPCDGCNCGCYADACNCHHSRNAGKPITAQLANVPIERPTLVELPRPQAGGFIITEPPMAPPVPSVKPKAVKTATTRTVAYTGGQAAYTQHQAYYHGYSQAYYGCAGGNCATGRAYYGGPVRRVLQARPLRGLFGGCLSGRCR